MADGRSFNAANFAFEMHHDGRCSLCQFRMVFYPPSGPVYSRVVLPKPTRLLAPGYRQLPGGHVANQSTNLRNCCPPVRVGLAKNRFVVAVLEKVPGPSHTVTGVATAAKMVLRRKQPDLVRQEFYGLMLAHFAIRGLMHEAALTADEDPDRLSFIHAVRVVRRKIARFATLPPSALENVP
jgi:hypothetical protein